MEMVAIEVFWAEDVIWQAAIVLLKWTNKQTNLSGQEAMAS